MTNGYRDRYEPLDCLGYVDYMTIHYPSCCKGCQWGHGIIA